MRVVGLDDLTEEKSKRTRLSFFVLPRAEACDFCCFVGYLDTRAAVSYLLYVHLACSFVFYSTILSQARIDNHTPANISSGHQC